MSLSSMYMDTPTAEISGTIANLRKEEADKKARNWKSAQDLLRGAAVDSIRKDYKDGISWDNGVQSADDSFKRQYERLMAVDPAAAQQLREDYLAERTKRVNAEVAGQYKSGYSGAGGEIQDLEREIQALEAEIQADEKAAAEAAKMEGYTPTSPDASITEVASRNDLKKATPELYAQQASAEEQMQGYTPEATGLRAFYGAYPEPAQQSALPMPRSGMQTQQESPEASSMRGYRPLNAWYGGMK